MVLKKDDLWNITRDMPAEEVEIFDAYGRVAGSIKMRGLSGNELTAYQDGLTTRGRDGMPKPNTRHAMAKLIVLCAVNDDGSPYFDRSETMKLDEAPARILMPLFESAQRLCGLTDEDFKELVENFGETLSDSSNSD